jgi:hypothetical protein
MVRFYAKRMLTSRFLRTTAIITFNILWAQCQEYLTLASRNETKEDSSSCGLHQQTGPLPTKKVQRGANKAS